MVALAVIGIVIAAVCYPGGLIDLDVYRMGARTLWAGHPLYEARAPRTGLLFTYPPFAAPLFSPLAYLPAAVARAAWTLVALAALAALANEARLIAGWPGTAGPGTAGPGTAGPAAGRRRTDPPGADRGRSALFATGVLFLAALPLEPVRSNLSLGQVNIALALVIVRDLTGRSGRVPAGLLTGVAAAIKLTPLIFIVHLAVTRRLRAAAVGLAGFLGCTAIAGLVAPRESWVFFSGRGFEASRVGGVAFVSNQSIYGALTRLGHGAFGVDAAYRPLALVVAAAGLLLARRATLTDRPMVGFTVCAVTGLLVSPISWSHHWIWVVVVLPWLAGGVDAPAWGRRAAAAGYVFFVASPIWWVPAAAELSRDGWRIAAVNSYVIVAVAFVVALVIRPGVTARTREIGPGLIQRFPLPGHQ
jgi:alpha-1,2-mannosyltransferase